MGDEVFAVELGHTASMRARLFVAIWPTEEVNEELRALRRKDQRGVRFVAPENWHITLRFLGDAVVDDVIGALDGFSADPARATLGPAVDVLDQRALVVPVGGVDSLAADVVVRTRHIGSEPARARFRGHLTLARVKKSAPMPTALGARIDAAFDVTEIALVRSRLSAGGPRYETLQTWPVG